MAVRKFIAKEIGIPSDQYIGRTGEIWIGDTDSTIRVGNDTTPGGIVVNNPDGLDSASSLTGDEKIAISQGGDLVQTSLKTAAPIILQTKQTPPSSLTTVVYGDSRSGNSTFSGSIYRITQQGHLNWASLLSRGRLRPLPTGEINFGVAGETSAQILARIDTVLASSAQVVIFLASVNDATGASSVSNVTQIIETLTEAGKIVIAIPEIPRAITGGGWTTDRVTQHLGVRTAILAMQNNPNLIVADPWPYMADPASAGGPLSGMLYDSPAVHQAPTGGYYIGRAISNAISSIFPEPALLPASNGDVYHATYAPQGCLHANPIMTGTAGTESGGATGDTPDGWQLVRGGSNLTVTGSKVTSGGKEWFQVVVTGTAPDANQTVTIQPITSSHTSVSVGEQIEVVGEFEMDASNVGLWGPSLEIWPIGTGIGAAQAANWFESGRANGTPVAIAHSGVVIPRPYTVAGTLTSLKPRWVARAESGANVNATFRVRATAMRKVAI